MSDQRKLEPCQIKDWAAHYENAKSKSITSLAWCPIPNKQDGLGYGRLMAEKDGPLAYCGFIAAVLVCSKQKHRDGWLTDDGTGDGEPLTPRDLELMSKVPAKCFDRMYAICGSKKVGWISWGPAGIPWVPEVSTPENRREGTEQKEKNGQYTDRFNDFWKVYPRRVSKSEAAKAFAKLTKDQESMAIEGAGRYSRHCGDTGKDADYIAHAATWLNQARWEDDYTTPTNTGGDGFVSSLPK